MKQKRKQQSSIGYAKNDGQFNCQKSREAEIETNGLEYSRRFMKKSEELAGEGKLVYITQKHHEMISLIVNTLGDNNMNIFSYVKNVLDEHFEKEKAVIKTLYKEHCDRNIL